MWFRDSKYLSQFKSHVWKRKKWGQKRSGDHQKDIQIDNPELCKRPTFFLVKCCEMGKCTTYLSSYPYLFCSPAVRIFDGEPLGAQVFDFWNICWVEEPQLKLWGVEEGDSRALITGLTHCGCLSTKESHLIAGVARSGHWLNFSVCFLQNVIDLPGGQINNLS